jgi:mono/diheme cytochrome c family protein
MAGAIQSAGDRRLTIQAMFSALALAYALAHAMGKTAAPDSAAAGTEARGPDQKKAASAGAIEVFRSRCLECHDVDGRGDAARDGHPQIPDFTDSKWHASRSDAELSRSILEGKGKSMPKMKNKLGSVEVKDMVAFVRGFKDGKQVVEDEPEDHKNSAKSSEPKNETARENGVVQLPQPASRAINAHVNQQANAGRGIFQRLCKSCHGLDGMGTALRDQTPSIPDFTSQVWQQRHSPPELMIVILEGKGTVMPAFRGKLNEIQVRDVVTYLRAFAPQPASALVGLETDFKRRFGQLTQELDDLKKQFQDLSKK